jgi:hypothetical protein
MSASYSSYSPYYTTDLSKGYLDVISFRDIPNSVDDVSFTVTSKYANRPDLLAYDLYGDSRFWWVFAVRNKTIILDPIYDLVAGTNIFLPQLSTIKNSTGV